MNRLFLAVPLTEPARAAIRAALATALPAGAPGRAVRPESWHLTLRFLGDTAPDQASRLAEVLSAAALGPPFQLAFAWLGAFPRPDRAAVLWLGVATGAAELGALAAVVERSARDAGFPAERRPFSAHLTLSRIRPPADVAPLVARPTGPPISMPVTEVVLFRSHLGGGPARYEAAARFSLV
jgi:RNA 2',3'-cyclic 3'-phosphodiesterase